MGVGIAAWVLIAVAKLSWDAHYLDGYDASIPLNPQVREEADRDGYHRVYFSYEAFPGKPVPALLALPLGGKGPYPALIFLHGIGQDKEFLDDIAKPFTEAGFAFATFDQSMQGERKMRGASPLEQGLALRRRGALTINEGRRLADYLETRPEIDKNRLYLIGASYGAITGATLAAFDKRFKAVMLTYGGGNFQKLAGTEEISQRLGPLTSFVAAYATWVMGPCDPVLYVDGISPRPIFFQNGSRDRIVVPAAAQALFDAAREPKEIKWYPSDHLDLSPEYIPIALQDGLEWIKVQDAKIAAQQGGS